MPVSHRIIYLSLLLCQSSIIQLFSSFCQNSVMSDLGGILVVVSIAFKIFLGHTDSITVHLGQLGKDHAIQCV